MRQELRKVARMCEFLENPFTDIIQHTSLTKEELDRLVALGWELDGFGGAIPPPYTGPTDDDGLPLGRENPV